MCAIQYLKGWEGTPALGPAAQGGTAWPPTVTVFMNYQMEASHRALHVWDMLADHFVRIQAAGQNGKSKNSLSTKLVFLGRGCFGEGICRLGMLWVCKVGHIMLVSTCINTAHGLWRHGFLLGAKPCFWGCRRVGAKGWELGLWKVVSSSRPCFSRPGWKEVGREVNTKEGIAWAEHGSSLPYFFGSMVVCKAAFFFLGDLHASEHSQPINRVIIMAIVLTTGRTCIKQPKEYEKGRLMEPVKKCNVNKSPFKLTQV